MMPIGDLLTDSLRLADVRRGPRVLSLTELAQYLNGLFDADPVLQSVWLRGEVSNCKRAPSGHWYFTLKDDQAQLPCVLFRSSAARSRVQPESGMALVAHGQLRFYEQRGNCEMIADLLFPEGMGLQQMQFELLYKRLQAEGLFDEARKRPLPAFPSRIGIATSESGAVIHDLLTVLERRYPLARVVFCPAQVQGDGAPASLCAAIRTLGAWTDADGEGLDVLVMGRGGGSAEDLAAFNDESVVRAIFASRVPVVSAVGHETDVTLADLAADLRAPTPSAAAEMITPDLAATLREVHALRDRAARTTRATLLAARGDVQVLAGRAQQHVAYRLALSREQLHTRHAQLEALSPLATLERGFAIVELNGEVLTDAGQAEAGATLNVRLRRGALRATVSVPLSAP
jgi:exodeoxyribonuclease VII large subunit